MVSVVFLMGACGAPAMPSSDLEVCEAYGLWSDRGKRVEERDQLHASLKKRINEGTEGPVLAATQSLDEALDSAGTPEIVHAATKLFMSCVDEGWEPREG